MRELYHSFGCCYVEIKRSDKRDCNHCHGNGVDKNQNTCTHCNGHGVVWDNGSGYGFKLYTLKPMYN